MYWIGIAVVVLIFCPLLIWAEGKQKRQRRAKANLALTQRQHLQGLKDAVISAAAELDATVLRGLQLYCEVKRLDILRLFEQSVQTSANGSHYIGKKWVSHVNRFIRDDFIPRSEATMIAQGQPQEALTGFTETVACLRWSGRMRQEMTRFAFFAAGMTTLPPAEGGNVIDGTVTEVASVADTGSSRPARSEHREEVRGRGRPRQ